MKVKTRKMKVEFQTKDGDSIFVNGIETYQPERSKREDSDLEKYIDEVSFGWIRDTIKQRCGALNIVETQ